jgi:hypothetical protein
MDEQKERIHQLEMQLSVLRERLKTEQADRLALWPKAQLADTCLALVKRCRSALQSKRKVVVGVELRQVDLLLTDLARVMHVIECPKDHDAYRNQPCYACGATDGATEAPEGRYLRCNSCGYAG